MNKENSLFSETPENVSFFFRACSCSVFTITPIFEVEKKTFCIISVSVECVIIGANTPEVAHAYITSCCLTFLFLLNLHKCVDDV